MLEMCALLLVTATQRMFSLNGSFGSCLHNHSKPQTKNYFFFGLHAGYCFVQTACAICRKESLEVSTCAAWGCGVGECFAKRSERMYVRYITLWDAMLGLGDFCRFSWNTSIAANCTRWPI